MQLDRDAPDPHHVTDGDVHGAHRPPIVDERSVRRLEIADRPTDGSVMADLGVPSRRLGVGDDHLAGEVAAEHDAERTATTRSPSSGSRTYRYSGAALTNSAADRAK